MLVLVRSSVSSADPPPITPITSRRREIACPSASMKLSQLKCFMLNNQIPPLGVRKKIDGPATPTSQ
eukprot:scaffold465759_cov17-Prasinocladus_malaysianus.AAC.1